MYRDGYLIIRKCVQLEIVRIMILWQAYARVVNQASDYPKDYALVIDVYPDYRMANVGHVTDHFIWLTIVNNVYHISVKYGIIQMDNVKSALMGLLLKLECVWIPCVVGSKIRTHYWCQCVWSAPMDTTHIINTVCLRDVLNKDMTHW